jgi:peptidoglycan/xylan/chitin deacetylase (PgdA/CDA1 family)
MGVCYLAALILLWAGRRGKISRKVAAVVSAVCLLAGSGALAAAVYPIGNSYGKTVNRLTDLSGNGAVVVPSPGSARTTAPLPDGAAQKSVPESGMAIPAAATSGELSGPAAQKDNRENVSVISSGTVHDKWIALTFDDGPYPLYTDRLLDVLKAKRIRATFFLVAEQAQQYPELVRRMTAEGHTVGLHAFRHRDFLKLTEEEKRKDLEQGKKLLRDITGKNPVYWRPPHGFRDFSVMETAVAQSLTVVNWSVIPRDWTGIDSQEIYRRVMDKAEDGAIVLLHDGDSPGYKASRQATVDAVAPLIDSLREKRYHLVSLEEYVQAEKRPGQ